MTIKEQLIESLRKNNPLLNLHEGFPLYDVLITPAESLMNDIDVISKQIEDKLNISDMFDSEGKIKSKEAYDLLQKKFFLEESSDPLFQVMLTLILSNKPISNIIEIEDASVTSTYGDNYIIPKQSINVENVLVQDGKYIIEVIAESYGVDSPTSPCEWTLNDPATIDVDVLKIVSYAPSYSDSVLSESFTKADLLFLINNRSWDNIAALTSHLFKSLPYQPEKLEVLGRKDTEIESGVIPVEHSDGEYEYVSMGNVGEVLVSGKIETITIQASGLPYENGMYVYSVPETTPLYSVVSVKNTMHNDIPFRVNYFESKILTVRSTVEITYVTTNTSLMEAVNNKLLTYKGSDFNGTYKLRHFYPITIYVDSSCVLTSSGSPVGGTAVNTVNSKLEELIPIAENLDNINLSILSRDILERTGYIVRKFLVRYCGYTNYNSTVFNAAFDVNTTSYIPYPTQTFMKNQVEYSLTQKNTVVIGGHE